MMNIPDAARKIDRQKIAATVYDYHGLSKSAVYLHILMTLSAFAIFSFSHELFSERLNYFPFNEMSKFILQYEIFKYRYNSLVTISLYEADRYIIIITISTALVFIYSISMVIQYIYYWQTSKYRLSFYVSSIRDGLKSLIISLILLLFCFAAPSRPVDGKINGFDSIFYGNLFVYICVIYVVFASMCLFSFLITIVKLLYYRGDYIGE